MLQALFDRGCRLAVITGGEPFLWRDGVHGLEDVVERARDVGFAWVAVCTNGTFPLRSRADVLVVSVDGLPHQVERLRGDAWSRLRRSLETAEHPHVVGEMTVTSENVDDLERAAEHVVAMKPLAGVLFRLFTPYVGADDSLLLDEVQRSRAIDTLLATKRRHPRRVLNSFTALRAWRDGGWARPVWATLIACRGELTGCCCRGGIADARTCRHCGEPTAVEAWALQRLSPEALAGGLRML
jgi:MoaA/NifB/PqqE/SkfB family radical SAM enzyme